MNDDSSTAEDEEDTALLRKVGRWIRFNLRLPLPGTCPWYDARGEEVFRKSHSLIISSRPAVLYDVYIISMYRICFESEDCVYHYTKSNTEERQKTHQS